MHIKTTLAILAGLMLLIVVAAIALVAIYQWAMGRWRKSLNFSGGELWKA